MPPKAKGKPPKSPKLSKAEKEKLKKEEAERKAKEEEEAKLRAEQEQLEREERERQEREEKERLREEERARHQAEVDELQEVLQSNWQNLKTLQSKERAKSKWERYMLCDGTPDPAVTRELNTYMNLWREDKQSKPVKEVLNECEEALRLIGELENFLTEATEEDLSEENIDKHKEDVMKIQELINIKLDEATMSLLLNAGDHLDPEYQNLQFSASSENITMCVWGNCAKNPRIKSFTFEDQGVTVDLPKVLANGNIAVRILFTKYDHLSPLAKSYYPKVKKVLPDVVVEPPAADSENVEGEEQAEKEEKPNEDDIRDLVTPKTPSMASRASKGSRKKSGRRSASSSKSGRRSRKSSAKSVKSQGSESESQKEKDAAKEDQEGGEGGEEKEGDLSADELAAAQDIIDDDDDDDEDDEDVVDLRAFSAIGRIITVDLLELPPQPKAVNGWVMQQLVSPEVRRLPYCAGQTSTAPGSASSTTPGPPLSASATTNTMHAAANNLPIGVSFRLPGDVLFFEEPQLAHWEQQKNHWRLDGLSDIKFEDETKTVTFKMNSFSSLAATQDLYLNMPFQSWELRPHARNSCVFAIIAAVIELEIEIKDSLCCLSQPEKQKELKHLIGKWMTPKELITAMQRTGVNVFPVMDTDKYVSIQPKDDSLEKSLYYEMALTSSAFAYTWSKWNAECDKNKIVLQAVEQLEDEPPLEEDWSLYLIGTYNSSKLRMKEFDEAFSDDTAENTQLHSDLYHMVRDGASPEALRRVQQSNFLFVDCVHQLLSASKLIIYS